MKNKINLIMASLFVCTVFISAVNGQAGEPIVRAVPISTKALRELDEIITRIKFECAQPIECPQVDRNNTKKLAEAIEQVIITLSIYKGWIEQGLQRDRSDREWMKAQKLIHTAYDRTTAGQKDFYKMMSKVKIFPESYKGEKGPETKDAYAAIRRLNERLDLQVDALKNIEARFMIKPYPTPTLTVPATQFKPGQEITVSFTARPCYAENAWLGIVPSATAHKNESGSDQNKIAKKYISNRTSGSITFKAPAQPGSYDFRMFDADEKGNEVASVSFKVTITYTASEFVGTWEATGYGCNGPAPVQKIKIQLKGDKLVATKITGDDCVPAGKVTWEGMLSGSRITGRGQVSSGPHTALRWQSMTIDVVNKDELKGFLGVTYRRANK